MKVKVGIIGCGMITIKRHAPEYAENDDAQIIGFYDRNLDRAAALTKAYGGRVYESVEAMLADDEINTVSVCAPNFLHAPLTIQALESGKHVLCEKPMAQSTDETKAMLQAAKASGTKLMIGHNQRLMPTHKKAKEILTQGGIGRILSFQTSFKHSGPESWSVDKSNKTWFFKKDQTNFGVLGDLGAHKLDIIRYLLDDEVDEIFTTMMTLDKKDEKGDLIEVDDNTFSLFKMHSGISGSMHVSWTNYGHEDNSTIIYGDKGVMKIFGDFPDDIVLEMKDGSEVKYHVGNLSTNENQLKSGIIDAFVDAIVNDKQPLITGEDGHYTLATIMAGVESANKGCWVKVDYDID